jgi:hypothetical protein
MEISPLSLWLLVKGVNVQRWLDLVTSGAVSRSSDDPPSIGSLTKEVTI